MKNASLSLQNVLTLLLVFGIALTMWSAEALAVPAELPDEHTIIHSIADDPDGSTKDGTSAGQSNSLPGYEPCIPCGEIATQSAGGTDVVAPNEGEWLSQPLSVNVQIDLEDADDGAHVYDIISEIEMQDGYATVFVTGEFASRYPAVVGDIENRGHEIAVHGWQKGEDITVLNYEEQLALIQRSFSAVRMVVSRPEEVLDFKPQGYAFDDNTIRVLQNLGARSISGVFGSDDHETFPACWYVRSLGKVTFPYPISDTFWAIPVSAVEIDSKDVPLDDEHIDNPETLLDRLLAKYDEQAETKDPLIVVVHPSITGSHETRLSTFAQFLGYVAQNDGRVKPLSAMTHHTAYITDLSVSAPASASTGDEITLTVSYTANIYCPRYRFLIYGRYPGQDWQYIHYSDYCEFVYTGRYTFTRQVTIPPPPTGETNYTLRVVGRATHGGCPPIDDLAHWPNAVSYAVMQEVAVEVTQPLCIPCSITGPRQSRLNVIFVPDQDYWDYYPGDPLGRFREDIDHKIGERLGAVYPIQDNMHLFNFYYTEAPAEVVRADGSVQAVYLPQGFWDESSCQPFDMVMVLHAEILGDACGLVDRTTGRRDWRICTAEGPTRHIPADRSFIHEAGHGLFRLLDEYDAPRYFGWCATNYAVTASPSNIWASLDDCQAAAQSQGWDENECYRFTDCAGDRWKLGDPALSVPDEPETCRDNPDQRYCDSSYRYIMYDGQYFDNGFGKASEVVISHRFAQLPSMIDILYPCPWCPVYAEKLAEYSVSLHLNMSDDELSLRETAFSRSPSFKYYPGDYPFRAEIVSLTDESLGEYGFDDPRVSHAEIGWEGPYWEDDVDFALTLPYFHNAKTVNIYDAPGSLLLSVGVSRYASAIVEGVVTDYDGNPVSNAYIQVTGPGPVLGSIGVCTYTDQNGYYQLVALEHGDHTLSVTPCPYDNLRSTWARVSVSAGEIVSQDFVLSPAGSIAGTVTGSDGSPVSDVRLYLSGYETPRYATNEEGKFMIPSLQAGTHTVNIHAPGYDPWYISVNDTHVRRGTSVTVEVTLGQTTWVYFTQQRPPSPEIGVSPELFDFTLLVGQMAADTVSISNLGDAALHFEIEDYPLGMVVDAPSVGGIFDVRRIFITFSPPDISFGVETYTPLHGVEVWGYFWLDTDQDSSTGVTEEWWPGMGLNDIGADYVLFFHFSEWGSGAALYRWAYTYFEWIGSYPLSQDDDHFTISVPSSDIDDDGAMDVTFLGEGYCYETSEWSQDIVPEVGHGTTRLDEIDWLSLDPEYGTVEPTNHVDVTLTIDTTGLEPGQYQRFIVISSNDMDQGVLYIPVNLTVNVEATVTIDPETLNLQALGRWLTTYIELPEEYAVQDIDIGTVQLRYIGNEIDAEWGDVQDGVLVVKFDCATVAGWFEGLHDEEVELTVAGEVDGVDFEGTDTIRVIDPPQRRGRR